MSKETEVCGCKNLITLCSNKVHFYAYEEPYESGVAEQVSDDDEKIIDNICFHMTATVCKKCKKVYFWDKDDGTILNIENLVI